MTGARLLIGAVSLLVLAAAAGVPKATEAPEGGAIAWTRAGPGGGGWIQAVACDLRDPAVVFVGCDVGGFCVSTDGGRHYEIRNQGLRNYFVEAIAVHPRDSNILLLGTEGGIFRTTDQGRTWAWQRAGFPEVRRYACSAPIGCVCFDPQQPGVVFAGIGRPRWGKDGQGTIARSEDGGVTWRLAKLACLPDDAIVKDIEVKPDDGRTVLAATSYGVVRSADGGQTWTGANQGLPQGDPSEVEELAFAPSAPDVVYASIRTTARDGEAWNGGVYRSDDAGQSWEARCEGLPRQVGKRGQSPYMTSTVKEIVVDPRNPDVVYAGNRSWVTAGVNKTTDGGRHWTRASAHAGDGINMDYGWIRMWGPSVECLAISPVRPERILFGTSGHVFMSDDAGATWQQRYCEMLPDGRFAGTGLEVTCAHDVVPDPERPQRLYFCYADIGLLISDDRGQSFRRSHKGMKHDGNTFTVVPDPAKPDTAWATTGQWGSNQGDVCRSDDRGETWRVVGRPETGLPDGQTRHLVLDLTSAPGRRRLLVTSKENGVHESRDGGDSWTCLNGNLPPAAARQPRGLALDPRDGKHLVFAAGGSVASGAGVYETRDGGVSWVHCSTGLNVGDIQCLAVDPSSFTTQYLGVREYYDRSVTPAVLRPGGVFQSQDGGQTWRQALDYHFVSSIAVSPAPGHALYVATTDHPYHDDYRAEGLLRSTDGGATWTRENHGLSLPQASFVRVDGRDPSFLYLSTGGNGVFVGKDTAPPVP